MEALNSSATHGQNQVSEVKSEKVVKSRERKRSKFLSDPYINPDELILEDDGEVSHGNHVNTPKRKGEKEVSSTSGANKFHKPCESKVGEKRKKRNDLPYMKAELEKMASILKEKGNTLLPAIRETLEKDIDALHKKISNMLASSTSS